MSSTTANKPGKKSKPIPCAIVKHTPKTTTKADDRRKIVRVLTKANDLLADPKRWTTGRLSRDDRGQLVDSHHPKAETFCVLGACERLNGAGSGYDFWGRVIEDATGKWAPDVNDGPGGRTAARMLLRRAIRYYSKPARKSGGVE